ncbi:MAG: NAD(+) diphosphatase [Opitutaceae bacterium]|nr:NAD(+) diphosphatase [Opitutaceae bacterium]
MSFVHALHPTAGASGADGHVFAFAQDRQLARLDSDGTIHLPTRRDLAAWIEGRNEPLHVGHLDGRSCWLTDAVEPTTEPPAGWSWVETRALLQTAAADDSQAIYCARHLLHWRAQHRFCGRCGTATVEATDERAIVCPSCNARFFPSASPAVIVAVTRGDTLLLAHNTHWRSSMFSLLAGFLDPGETLEQAVAREVREEVGIEIGEIRYVTSQPWPFPNSLMAGFRAMHISGEIQVDGKEIAEAAWFTRDAMPEIPRRGSVARELIDGWLREGRSES